MNASAYTRCRFALLLTWWILLHGVASAAPLLTFGDSLTDTGRVAAPASYFSNRWSNGKVWAEYLPASFGTLSGNNYAEAGSTTGAAAFPKGLMQQIASAAGANPSWSSATCMVWSGGNDVRQGDMNSTSWIAPAADRVVTAVAELRRLGCKKIYVLNLPDIGKTPEFNTNAGATAIKTAHSQAFNAALHAGLITLLANASGLVLCEVDVFAKMNAVIERKKQGLPADPPSHAFSNVENIAQPLSGSVTFPGPKADYLFWDFTHPTTKAHSLIAEWVKAQSPMVVAPDIAVFSGSSSSPLADNGADIVMPVTTIGETSVTQTFTIQNAGSANLSAIAVSIDTSTGHPDDFVLNTSTLATTRAPGEKTTFTLAFKPTAAGTRRAVLKIASNDASKNPFEINVKGDAPSLPEITVSVAPSEVKEDSAGQMVFTFTRTGSTASRITAHFTLSGTAGFISGDYSPVPAWATYSTPSQGSLFINPGSSTAKVYVTPFADVSHEPDETIIVTLDANAVYTVGAADTAMATILNDEVASANANLSNLTCSASGSALTLSPVFAATTVGYSLPTLVNSTSLITIMATRAQANAIPTYRLRVADTDPFLPMAAVGVFNVPVSVGDNVIEVKVTAQNGSSKIYTINVARSAPLVPNLTFDKPSGWSDKIIVSSATGTRMDASPIPANTPLYVDFAPQNNGTATVAGGWHAKIYVDNEERWDETMASSLPAGFVNLNINDRSIGQITTAGSHVIKVVLDTGNNVTEADESIADNVFEKTINVVLTPQTTAQSSAFVGDLIIAPTAGQTHVHNNNGWDITAGSSQIGQFGTGVMNQTAGLHRTGNLLITMNSGASGTYNHTSGAVVVNSGGTSYIGVADGATGTYDQSSGTHTTPQMWVGVGTSAIGLYRQRGGVLNVAGGLSVGRGGEGTFEQISGSAYVAPLTVGDLISARGSYIMADGYLETSNSIVGHLGHGTFSQTGGYHSVTGALWVADQAGGKGDYVMSGSDSSLRTGNTVVGLNGAGTFMQNDGACSATNAYVGFNPGVTGVYTLQSGYLQVSNSLVIGHDGLGTFKQSGGYVQTPNNSPIVGHNAGSVGLYEMTGGTLNTPTAPLYVGLNGQGTFIQTGGSVTADHLRVGWNASGHYELRAGASLRVESSVEPEYIGYNGSGTFIQSGGSNDIMNQDLVLGYNPGSSGSYTISGGSLWGRNLILGKQGTGGLHVQGGTLGFMNLSTGAGVGTVNFEQGSIYTAGTSLNLGAAGLVVGDGSHLAQLFFNTGTHAITNGVHVSTGSELYLLSNASAAGTAVSLEGGTLYGGGAIGKLQTTAGSAVRLMSGYAAAFETLATGHATLDSSSSLHVRVATTGSDQIQTTGSVTLNEAGLVITVENALSVGQQIVLWSNDGADPIGGTFSSLPEGALVSLVKYGSPVATYLAQISYVGGTDGNDVVLRVVDGQSSLLTGLAASTGGTAITYAPSFVGTHGTYATTVPITTESLTLRPTAAERAATIEINGVVVKSGQNSADIRLNYGENSIAVIVTSPDGSYRSSYELIVQRSAPRLVVLDSNGNTLNSGLPRFILPDTPVGAEGEYTFIIRNDGDMPLSGIDVSGMAFSLTSIFWLETSSTASSLQPGQTTSFKLRWNPNNDGPSVASVRIFSNDPSSSYFSLAVTVNGGRSVLFASAASSQLENAVAITVPIRLSSPCEYAFSVPISYEGTATYGKDYSASTTMLRFAAGTTTANLIVTLKEDALIEGAETVIINLGTPNISLVALGSPPQFSLTILEDDVVPVIDPMPASKIVAVGNAVSLSSGATGSAPVTLQWKKNGTAVPNATGNTLSLLTTALADGGAYTMTATNTRGAVTSTAAQLAVVDAAPSIVRANPGSSAVMTVNATGNSLSYRWKKESTDLTNSTRSTGVTTKTLTVKNLTQADVGNYSCVVTGPGGSIETGARELQVPTTLPVPLALDFPDVVLGNAYSYQIPFDTAAASAPTAFTCTGLPAGLKLDGKSGLVTGKPTVPGTFIIKVSLSNSGGTVATPPDTMQVLPFPAGCFGTYVGLLGRHAAINGSLGGRIDITTTVIGGYTGTLKLGANSYALAGTLTTDKTPNAHPLAQIIISRTGASTITLALDFEPDTNDLRGSVSIAGDANPALLAGWRIVWRTTTPKNLVADQLGTHSFKLEPQTPGVASEPQGYGYGTIVTTTAGVTTVSGRTADGGTILATGLLGPDGEVMVYQLLNTNLGSLIGSVGITSNANHSLTGTLDWLKTPAAGTTHDYKAGFGPLVLNMAGGKYSYTAPVLGLPVTNASINNARLSFSEGGIGLSATQPNLNFRISSTNTIILPVAGSIANPGKVSFTLVPTTGSFSGKFTLTDLLGITRVVNYQGWLVPTEGKGYGWFMLPQLADPTATPPTSASTSAILSGRVVLDAALP